MITHFTELKNSYKPYWPIASYNKDHPYIRFIWYGLTPTGRVSKYFHEYRIFIKSENSIFMHMDLQQMVDYAFNDSKFPKLPKNYTWSEVYLVEQSIFKSLPITY